MEYHTRQVPVDELKVDIAVLARALGYESPGGERDGPLPALNKGRTMPPHMVELAEDALIKARPMLDPCWMWAIVPASLEHNALVCHNGSDTQLDVGSIVRTQLRGSAAFAFFVITVGSHLERYARELLLDAARSLEGYVLDTIGSIAVEAAGDALEKEISQSIADRGWKITNRFSPGYCTWETGGQQALFSLFPDQPAGVTLTESSLMSPIKSISGVIGLGPDVEHRPYMCDICSMTTCHQKLVHARL